MATQSGISVDLSFGGADSMLSDMTLSKVPVATQAQQLATFLQTYNFASVDFDIESPVIMQGNTAATVVSFFNQLHTLLKKAGKQSILTVEGGIAQGPGSGSPLSPLFTNFSTMFDGVNLMLYSTNQYYLDASNATWGIDQWLTYIKEPSLMHIGFYDSIDYTNPASSAGEQYAIPKGLTNGQAAAFIYLTMLSQAKYTVSEFGDPFFWTDDPTTISTNAFFTDFHNYIDANQTKFQKQ
ncbi:MAG: glycoside hydrolase family 18 protein [Chlamydiota bacterium]